MQFLRTIIIKDKVPSYQLLLKNAKLPFLLNSRPQDICILMYKVKHTLCSRTICNLLMTNSHSYNLRQTDFYLHVPRFSTVKYGKHSIRYLGPKLWSKLSSKDRSAATLRHFKTVIRKHDLSNIVERCSECHLCNS